MGTAIVQGQLCHIQLTSFAHCTRRQNVVAAAWSDASLANVIGDQYAKTVGEFRSDFDEAYDAFDRSIALKFFKAIDVIGEYCSIYMLRIDSYRVKWNMQLDVLVKMHDARDIAHFKSDKGNICLEGTHVDLLSDVEARLHKADSSCFFLK